MFEVTQTMFDVLLSCITTQRQHAPKTRLPACSIVVYSGSGHLAVMAPASH